MGLLISLAAIARGQNTIATVAGGGPNNLPAISVGINNPWGVCNDAAGNLYLSSDSNSDVYKVSPSGQLTSVAGNETQGFSGDGGLATSAALNSPEGVSVDAAGNIFVTDSGNNRIREVVASTGDIQTVAGNGTRGFSGDGGPATSAELDGPNDVFVDAAGDIFIADAGSNNRIREVMASTGNIQTVVGNGTDGFSGDGGLATTAALHNPMGVSVDAAGNIFIADSLNNRIREVVASTGKIQTVAGNGTIGFSGDGGLATSAELDEPDDLFVDAAGDIFIADSGNNRIREVVGSTSKIQTVAGNETRGFSGDGGLATSAELSWPTGVSANAAGNIFIADDNNRIREVVASTRNIKTVAGNGTDDFSGDGGLATSAALNHPNYAFLDATGNIFIADTGNNRVREVVAFTGKISTVAGNGAGGFRGDGGAATSAELYAPGPKDVFVDAAGNIFIADTGNNRIREVVASTRKIKTVAGNGTLGFTGDGKLATAAEVAGPTGVFVDTAGDIFFSDSVNNRIREVVASTGNIKTVAGNGTHGYSGDGGPATSAALSYPDDVFGDAAGDIFFADRNSRIREVAASTGNIQTVAGNGTRGFSGDGGRATSAELDGPDGVFVDAVGDIFIAESGNNNRVREVVASTGTIKTVAGNGACGFRGDGGLATSAELCGPTGVFVDAAGDIFFADTGNNRIREVVANQLRKP
jgi:hypothetical protein